MKKLLALLMAVLFCATLLVGCGGNSNQSGAKSTQPPNMIWYGAEIPEGYEPYKNADTYDKVYFSKSIYVDGSDKGRKIEVKLIAIDPNLLYKNRCEQNEGSAGPDAKIGGYTWKTVDYTTYTMKNGANVQDTPHRMYLYAIDSGHCVQVDGYRMGPAERGGADDAEMVAFLKSFKLSENPVADYEKAKETEFVHN